MELIVFFAIIMFFVFAFAAGRGQVGVGGGGGGGLLTGFSGNHDSQISKIARSYGVTLHNTYLIHSGGAGQYDSGDYVYGFSGVDKAGVQVTGQVRVGFGGGTMTFDSSGAGARAARAQAKLAEEEGLDEATLDPEEQVRREVARRLDTLQANRDAFMSNDTDGDGMVDAEEWAAARARIEEQVRVELGAAAAQSPDPPAPEPPAVSDGEW